MIPGGGLLHCRPSSPRARKKDAKRQIRSMQKLKSYLKRELDLGALCRSLKAVMEVESRLLKAGHWKINPRFAYHVEAGAHELTSLFRVIAAPDVRKKPAMNPVHELLSPHCRGRVLGGIKDAQVTLLYRSRNGDLKFFELETGRVLTPATRDAWEEEQRLREKPLFRFFMPPAVEFATLDGRGFLAEELLQAKSLQGVDPEQRSGLLVELINRYGEYVEVAGIDAEQARAGDMAVTDLPAGIGLDEATESSLREFLARVCWVVAHLDFNIANILHDGTFRILDNGDTGLLLPAFYDVVNVAFNQVNYWDDTEWLDLLLGEDVRPAFLRFCGAYVRNFHEEELVMVFLACFAMLHSERVRDRLHLPRESPPLVAEAFRQFVTLLDRRGIRPGDQTHSDTQLI